MEERKGIMPQDDMMNEMRSLKQSLLVNRIISIVSSVISLVMVVLLIIGISRLNTFVEEIRVVADKVSEIDMVQVNSAIEKFNTTMDQVDFENINQVFEEVDMKAVGEIVETIDAAELEETLENINNVSEKLKKISDKISGFFSFGRDNN